MSHSDYPQSENARKQLRRVFFLREKKGGIIVFIPKTHPGCNPQKEYITPPPPLFRVGKKPSGYISQGERCSLQNSSAWVNLAFRGEVKCDLWKPEERHIVKMKRAKRI